jgi:hypothetical protein
MVAYLKWLRNPSGAYFAFDVRMRDRLFQITLPCVKVKRG